MAEPVLRPLPRSRTAAVQHRIWPARAPQPYPVIPAPDCICGIEPHFCGKAPGPRNLFENSCLTIWICPASQAGDSPLWHRERRYSSNMRATRECNPLRLCLQGTGPGIHSCWTGARRGAGTNLRGPAARADHTEQARGGGPGQHSCASLSGWNRRMIQNGPQTSNATAWHHSTGSTVQQYMPSIQALSVGAYLSLELIRTTHHG